MDNERHEPIERKIVPLLIDGSTLYEGDFAVHYERGICAYAGRWQEDGRAEESWPVLLRFADRVVAVDAMEARKQLTLLRRGNERLGEAVEGSDRTAEEELLPPIWGLTTSQSESPEQPDGTPKLSRLKQPQAWLNKRRKAVAISQEHARELVTLAAARRERSREPCEPLSEASRAILDEGLGFKLTEGQERCVVEVEEDMCRRLRPMDRLVFGDVGYGKTEVALRAIAIAVHNGRQAALVAPTTILATQHYHTLRNRLAPLGIQVELLLGLSKASSSTSSLVFDALDGASTQGRRGRPRKDEPSGLKPRAEYQRVRMAIANGACDVAIGTQALLSRRQSWKNLGLAVIDEEQRFGVAQKEQLKSMCVDVDMLTLSATPIPRTLGAALSGIRDVSELPKPPPGRGVTKTIVVPDESGVPQDDARISSMLDRELSRGGQCFYVVPHIADIDAAVRRVSIALQTTGRAVIGDTVLPIAHSEVPDAASVIADFAAGDNVTRPVLIATTLVENGLDLPRVNTIIVQDAYRFGLASLHQLRGRVGRGDRPALACFLYPRRNALTPSARARLRAIADRRHQTGPELAKRDLEIRGAGAMLGTRQSGKVARFVGADLYARLLTDELARLRALDIEPLDKCDATMLPVAAGLRVEHPLHEQLQLASTFDQVTQLVKRHRSELTPHLKLAIKLRMLELHAARLGFDSVSLREATASEQDAPASAFISAPKLDPSTWDVLRREVPETLRANLRFDQPAAVLEVMRLGALEPPKQLDFLLEVLMHMTTFLDRVMQIRNVSDCSDRQDSMHRQLTVDSSTKDARLVSRRAPR